MYVNYSGSLIQFFHSFVHSLIYLFINALLGGRCFIGDSLYHFGKKLPFVAILIYYNEILEILTMQKVITIFSNRNHE